jgi:hypothetical protein
MSRPPELGPGDTGPSPGSPGRGLEAQVMELVARMAGLISQGKSWVNAGSPHEVAP